MQWDRPWAYHLYDFVRVKTQIVMNAHIQKKNDAFDKLSQLREMSLTWCFCTRQTALKIIISFTLLILG